MQTKGRKLLGKLGGSREEGGTERGERGVCLFLRIGGGGGGGEGRREKWRKRYCRIRATSDALTSCR